MKSQMDCSNQEVKDEIVKLGDITSKRFFKIEYSLEKIIEIIEEILKKGFK